MKRLTQQILEEARKMITAWIAANPEGDIDWYLREIASIKGVEYRILKKKLKKDKTKKGVKILQIRR